MCFPIARKGLWYSISTQTGTMKYIIHARVTPERTAVSLFTPHVWQNENAKFTVECDASQLIIRAEYSVDPGWLHALITAEHVAASIISAFGFANGCGYGVELVSIVPEEGQSLVIGVKPGNLEFADIDRAFLESSTLIKKDVYLRLALVDYTQAITQPIDCAHYCNRVIEALRSGIGMHLGLTQGGNEGQLWLKFHEVLATNKAEIVATIKSFADPVRHGNWANLKPTTSEQRMSMLKLTKSILGSYIDWRQLTSATSATPDASAS